MPTTHPYDLVIGLDRSDRKADLHLIDTRTDAIHVVPLCGTCWTGISVLGQATIDPDQLYWAVL